MAFVVILSRQLQVRPQSATSHSIFQMHHQGIDRSWNAVARFPRCTVSKSISSQSISSIMPIHKFVGCTAFIHGHPLVEGVHTFISMVRLSAMVPLYLGNWKLNGVVRSVLELLVFLGLVHRNFNSYRTLLGSRSLDSGLWSSCGGLSHSLVFVLFCAPCATPVSRGVYP